MTFLPSLAFFVKMLIFISTFMSVRDKADRAMGPAVQLSLFDVGHTPCETDEQGGARVGSVEEGTHLCRSSSSLYHHQGYGRPPLLHVFL